MKICGPLSWNNELIWSMHKERMAQILKVTLKQTLIFYCLDQKMYAWRTTEKSVAKHTHTHRHICMPICIHVHTLSGSLPF